MAHSSRAPRAVKNVRDFLTFDIFQNGSDPKSSDHVGVDGDVPGAAHHTAADQTETELVPDIHADLAGRRAHCAVYNMFLRAQQLVSDDDRDAGVLRQPPVHNIRHLPDEDHRPADPVLQNGEPEPPAAHVLRVHAHLDAHRVPDHHRDTAPGQTLQRLIAESNKPFCFCTF